MTGQQVMAELEQRRVEDFLRSLDFSANGPAPDEAVSDDPLENYLLHRTANELRAARLRRQRHRR